MTASNFTINPYELTITQNDSFKLWRTEYNKLTAALQDEVLRSNISQTFSGPVLTVDSGSTLVITDVNGLTAPRDILKNPEIITSTTNWNNLTSVGYFKMDAASQSNTPDGTTATWNIEITEPNTGIFVQTATKADATNVKMFTRIRGTNSVWGQWNTIITSNGDYTINGKITLSNGSNRIRSFNIGDTGEGYIYSAAGTDSIHLRVGASGSYKYHIFNIDGSISSNGQTLLHTGGGQIIATTLVVNDLITAKQGINATGGVILAGDIPATNGSHIIDGYYSGSNVLNSFGAQYSSGASVIGYAVKTASGIAGYESSAGNGSFSRAAFEVGANGSNAPFKFLRAAASTAAIGTSISMIEIASLSATGIFTTARGTMIHTGVDAQTKSGAFTVNGLLKQGTNIVIDAGDIDNSAGTGGGVARYLKNNYTAVQPPGVNDDISLGYVPGSSWYDSIGNKSYKCVDNTNGIAVWNLASITASDLGSYAFKSLSDNIVHTGNFSVNQLLTADKLVIAGNPEGTETDILLNGNSNIASTGNMNFYIDSDNNSTTTTFRWSKNTGSLTGAVSLMILTESGVLSVGGAEVAKLSTSQTFTGNKIFTGNIDVRGALQGQTIGGVTNVNTLNDGLYRFAGSTSLTGTRPNNNNQYGIIWQQTDSAQPTQLYFGGNGTPGIAVRRKDSGTWTAWSEMEIKANLKNYAYKNLSDNIVHTGNFTVNQVLTADKLVLGSNSEASETDLHLSDNANVSSGANMNFYIDSDNNSSDRTFNWRANSENSTGDKQLMSLGEDGILRLESNTANPLKLIAGVANAMFIEFYPKSSDTNSRGAYFGFGGVGSSTMTIKNEYANGKLALTTQGSGTIHGTTYQLRVDGTSNVPVHAKRTTAGTSYLINEASVGTSYIRSQSSGTNSAVFQFYNASGALGSINVADNKTFSVVDNTGAVTFYASSTGIGSGTSGAFTLGNAYVGSVGFEIGSRVAGGSDAYIDFHSSAAASADYNARILCGGGDSSTGNGSLSYYAASHKFYGDLSIDSSNARLIFNESDEIANNRRWDLLAQLGKFVGRVYNDAFNSSTTWLAVSRTLSSNIPTIDLYSDKLTATSTSAANFTIKALGGIAYQYIDSSSTNSAYIEFRNTSVTKMARITAYNGKSLYLDASNGVFVTSTSGNCLTASATNSCRIRSVGSNGYGAFTALSSGTNNSYIFFENASGERNRITSYNTGTITIGTYAAPGIEINANGNTHLKNSTTTIIGSNIAGNTAIEFGSQVAGGSSAILDFHSSGSSVADYNSRIIADGGDANIGSGNLTFRSSLNTFWSKVRIATKVVSSAYMNAAVEIREYNYEGVGTGAVANKTPRLAFHYSGYKAAQIGLDLSGYIRTYDNPGTGYEGFNSSTINVYGTGAVPIKKIILNGASGNIDADGDITAFSTSVGSDPKLKENIFKIENALTKVSKLNGVTFNWKKNSKEDAGLLSTDVKEVLPEAVKLFNSPSGLESHEVVNYNAVIGLLVESIKDLKSQVELLKAV